MSESKQLTPRRTPLQSRPYLSAVSHGFHQYSPHHYSGTGSAHQMSEIKSVTSEQMDMIYGTNISTRHVYDSLERFVKQFQVYPESSQQQSQRIYQTQLSQMDIMESQIFSVSAQHLKQFDRDLYYQFIYFPAEMIMCFDEVIKSLFEKMYMGDHLSPQQNEEKQAKRDRIMVAIKNIGDVKIMRAIGPAEINKLISFRGIVVRTSDIVPEMKRAFFKCVKCQSQMRIMLENAKVQEPKACPKCFSKQSFQLVHNLCEFTDKQFIKFQQMPEYVPEGQTPHSISVVAYDYNVDMVKPGDRVQVVGIYRVQHQKVVKSKSQISSVFKTHLDLISFNIMDDQRLKGSIGEQSSPFNDKDKEEFLRMASDKDIVKKLVASFAPSIHGHMQIKKGILAQLFGGTKAKRNTADQTNFRADINICLVGDPSTAKSQLLQQVYKIAPRGIYTSGTGSSAVGLTANVKRDPQTKEFVLESGALVLSDQGICCIDQFDKMDQNNKTILLQGMQQQTISIAKAGIVCQLNCRAAIIAAANPIHSRYNRNKSVVQNINLSPALLSRFDLIYLMLDQPQQQEDKNIAQHLLNMYISNDPQFERERLQKKGVFPKDVLTKYITFARQYFNPEISEGAANALIEAYGGMRKMGTSTKTITATPRQLQSLIRLSQAFAKMKLSNQVMESDVYEALELMKIAIHQTAIDPLTGKIDMDVLVTGKTSALRQKILNLSLKIKQIVCANVSKYKNKSTFKQLFSLIDSTSGPHEKPNEKEMFEALKMLEMDGLLALFGNDKFKPNFKLAKQLG